eukprot:NODE_4082_length_712_cov_335.211568.p1 GENE.NODE_4082_length_712_cov_335.211568~~NODE_4082_length_712_cov_335.211568.p1  ORF type:complete len:189 (-),score=23.38 NODE_4082_length_712_cov_335.211568:129-674(-)
MYSHGVWLRVECPVFFTMARTDDTASYTFVVRAFLKMPSQMKLMFSGCETTPHEITHNIGSLLFCRSSFNAVAKAACSFANACFNDGDLYLRSTMGNAELRRSTCSENDGDRDLHPHSSGFESDREGYLYSDGDSQRGEGLDGGRRRRATSTRFEGEGDRDSQLEGSAGAKPRLLLIKAFL